MDGRRGREGIWGGGSLRMTMFINAPGMTGNDYFTSFCTIRLEKTMALYYTL